MKLLRLLPGIVIAAALVMALGALATAGSVGGSTRVTQAERAHDIAATVHCPVCADLSAAESPAPLARQMRDQIRTQLAAGATAEEIRQQFVAAYGPSVLMSPPNRGWGRTAHLAPLLLLTAFILTGCSVLTRGLRAQARTGRT